MTDDSDRQILRIAQEARAAIALDSDATFTSDADEFVHATSRIFRKPAETVDNRMRRGRPKKRRWKTSIFLLHKPMTTLKDFKEALTWGFGPPRSEDGNPHIYIDRSWTIENLENYVVELYSEHPLSLVGFKFAKCKKGCNQTLCILNPASVEELAREIKAGKLFIIPTRQLPRPKDKETDITGNTNTLPVGEPFMSEVTLQPTMSEVTQPSMSEVTQPSMSEVTQPSMSEVTQPSMSEVTQPSMSEVTQPSMSEVTQPSMSEVIQPSMSVTQPSMSVTQPSMSTVTSPSMSVTQPSISEDVQPSRSGMQLSTSVTQPFMSEVSQPSMSESEPDVLPVLVRPIRRQPHLCLTCHRTLNGSNCLHCIQDAEFAESLQTDQQKDEDNLYEIALNKLREERRIRLPEEPENGVKIKFITSNGSCSSRIFNETDKIQVLLDYVGSRDEALRNFKMNIPSRGTFFSSCTHACASYTLKEIGVNRNTLIRVQWIVEDDKDTDIDSTCTCACDSNTRSVGNSGRSDMGSCRADEEQYRLEEETSRIEVEACSSQDDSTRPRRMAAIACNHRMQSWMHEESDIHVMTPNESMDLDTSIPNEFAEIDTYRNYVDIVCLSDSAESDSSLLEEDPVSEQLISEDAVSTLKILADQIKTNQVTRINVHRPSIWECTLRKFKKKDFSPENDLLIKFSDDFGTGEEGIDQGGPKREYLSLLIKYLLSSHLFEGPDHSKTLAWNKSACESDHYLVCGMVFAISIVHGGPAPHCLAPSLVKALEVGPKNTQVSIEDMPEHPLKEKLNEVLKAKTEAKAVKLIDKIEFIDYAGINTYNLCSTEIVGKAVHAYLFDRTSSAFEQFKTGLKTLQVYENIKKLKSLFLYKNVKVDREKFEELFEYDVAPEGSNARERQTAVIALWRDFLEDVRDGTSQLTFEQLLQFCTGAMQVPALGFNPSPKISFWDERFPKGNTCSNNLVLPLDTSCYEQFVENMEFGVLNSQGFWIA